MRTASSVRSLAAHHPRVRNAVHGTLTISASRDAANRPARPLATSAARLLRTPVFPLRHYVGQAMLRSTALLLARDNLSRTVLQRVVQTELSPAPLLSQRFATRSVPDNSRRPAT